MGIGKSIKRFLADEIGIDARTQFYVYGTVLLLAIIISIIKLEGADPFNNVKFIAWRAYQMTGV